MSDRLSLFKPRVRAPRVNVANPVLARYLDDLAKTDRIASEWDALAGAARGVDDVLPPRGPVPPADLNVAIEGMMPSGPAEPFADILRRNDRTRALVNSRLDRLSPEERVGSLGMVGRQAESDAAMRRRQHIESDMDLGTRLGLLAGAGALAGGLALKPGEDEVAEAREAELARRRERDAAIDAGILREVDDISVEDHSPVEMYRHEPDLQGLMREYLDSAGRGLAESARAATERRRDLDYALSASPDGAMPMALDIGADMLIEPYDPLAKMAADAPVPEPGMDDGTSRFVQKFVARHAHPGEIDVSGLFADDPLVDFQPDSPEAYAAASPGPASPVGMNRDLEDLPGPQMRSVRALMAAGIPEGRAMAIIVKGSSMSPDEYRMVTGGRR